MWGMLEVILMDLTNINGVAGIVWENHRSFLRYCFIELLLGLQNYQFVRQSNMSEAYIEDN